MPFTLSHPAAVLPLLRGPFVPVALIAGAIVPDLPYFLNVPVTAQSWYEPFVNATFSHSFKGILLVGLPSVVLIAFLFRFVRRPLGDLLPLRLDSTGYEGMQRRGRLSYGSWFLISALMGLATHVVWDSITHGGSLVGVELPFLQADLVAGLAVNRFLQHASTLLGAIAIVVWCVRRLRSRELSIEWVAVSRARAMQRLAIALAVFLASAVFAVFSVLEVRDRDGALGLELTLSLFLKSGIRIAVVALVIYALVWHIVYWSRRFSAQGSHLLSSDEQEAGPRLRDAPSRSPAAGSCRRGRRGRAGRPSR